MILKSIIIEVFIITIYIFLINIYIGNVDKTIHADGGGYYDYLPSIFIHHDLVRKDIPVEGKMNIYKRIQIPGVYINFNESPVNKYTCGTAVLQLPFFLYAYLTTDLEGNSNDGYQLPFQKVIFHAAIFYLFLSIFFMKKTLGLFNIKKYVIILSQVFLVLATSVTHYANYDAGFSHVYSLFAITAFIYFITAYFRYRNVNHFVLACIFLGLILILRQINILIILFIPFLAGSIRNFKDGLIYLFRHPLKLLIGIFLIFSIFFIQCLLWYLQTGHFFIYTYQGEGFNFLDPHLFRILFSYKKGLFVYTPILFISLFSLIWLTWKRRYYLFFTWILFFVVLTYVLSSWYSWSYACSYGLRAYIDYYAIFFIPFALMLNELVISLKIIVIIFSFLTIPLNIIQTYQYKTFILHWDNMDKEKYWRIFLKTEDKYKGLLWKKQYNYSLYQTVKEISFGNLNVSRDRNYLICEISTNEIPEFQKICVVQVLIDNDYKEENDSKIILSIKEPKESRNFYCHESFLIHFMEKDFDEWQTGLFNFDFDPITDQSEKIVTLVVYSGNQEIELKNVRIKFLKHS